MVCGYLKQALQTHIAAHAICGTTLSQQAVKHTRESTVVLHTNIPHFPCHVACALLMGMQLLHARTVTATRRFCQRYRSNLNESCTTEPLRPAPILEITAVGVE